ncbi:MAG: protein kinase [Planctomycetia bacterium]|nr:protein kinase [Planctomycetia bacterium]
MTSKSNNEIQIIFEAVCRLSPSERTTWYTQHETADTVRQEVEELLRYDSLAQAESFFTPRSGTGERDVLMGTCVGPYEVIRLIGRGGMGSVYHARRKVPYEQDVAIKVADLRLGSGAARFHEERQVLADLHHPGIAKLLDGGILPDDRPYLVMEHVPGEHIDSYADSNKLRVMERVQLWLQVCEAMASAHKRGIIHRDLKPSNVLVTQDRRVVVVDFGLARRWEQSSGLTRTAMVLGTPEYMSPEQATGKKGETTPATDVYALGAVLYTLLTGRPPFRSESPLQLVTLMLQDEPVSPRRLNPAVSRDLETICLHALHKNPSDRYQNAGELVEECKRLLAGQPILARPTPLWKRGWLWARRRPGMAIMGAVLLATIITSLVAIGFYWRKAFISLETAKKSAVQIIEHAMSISKVPGMQRAQVELLRQAIASFDPVVRELQDEQITLQYLRARRQLEATLQDLGLSEEDEKQSFQLLQETRRYVELYPSAEMNIELSYVLRSLGRICASKNKVEESRAYRLEYIQVLRDLVNRFPQRHSILGLYADSLTFMGHLEEMQGHTLQADDLNRQALQIYQQLYTLYPNDPQARIRFAGCIINMERVYATMEEKDQIRYELLRQIHELDMAFKRESPKRIDYRIVTSDGTRLLAVWYMQHGELINAQELLSELIGLHQQLIQQYPDVPSHASILACLYFQQGIAFHNLKQSEEAVQAFNQFYSTYEQVLKKTGNRFDIATSYSMRILECPVTSLRNLARCEELTRYYATYQLQKQTSDPTLGILRLRQNRLPEARDLLTEAFARRRHIDEPAQYHLYLALVYAKLGEVAKAREHLAATTRYFQRFPKDILLGQVRAEVEAALKK